MAVFNIQMRSIDDEMFFGSSRSKAPPSSRPSKNNANAQHGPIRFVDRVADCTTAPPNFPETRSGVKHEEECAPCEEVDECVFEYEIDPSNFSGPPGRPRPVQVQIPVQASVSVGAGSPMTRPRMPQPSPTQNVAPARRQEPEPAVYGGLESVSVSLTEYEFKSLDDLGTPDFPSNSMSESPIRDTDAAHDPVVDDDLSTLMSQGPTTIAKRSTTEKARLRRAKNTEAVRRSRARTLQRVGELEEQLDKMAKENLRLKEEVRRLRERECERESLYPDLDLEDGL